ncbi:MAG TPA: DUF2115 domain-containing protein [Methanocorpusculum sp.]|nr:DUF2115 domain-containing protein [Methanocorpusculum sp.]
MNVFDYSEDDLRGIIRDVCQHLAAAESGGEAVSLIIHALRRFTIYDLVKVGASIRAEVEKLPEPYKSRYRTYAQDLLTKYHELMSSIKEGVSFSITDKSLWKKYWQSAAEYLLIRDTDPRSQIANPAGRFFYRLVYAYVMLIAGKPGHPVGTPFPGGGRVREENGEILCPIRDKEKDLPEALCNFCPAKQDERCL